MGRIRTVKPELFRHEELFEAEKNHQLPLRIAFAGLFTCCDREGRFRWKPKQLKLDILPYDELDMTQVLNALLETGFIQKYQVGTEHYGCIPSWNKHQCLNHRERPSVLPAMEEAEDSVEANDASVTESSSVGLSCAHSETMPRGNGNGREYGNGKGNGRERHEHELIKTDESKKTNTVDILNRVHDCNIQESKKSQKCQKNLASSNLQADIHQIFEHWKTILGHPQALLDKKRASLIEQALKSGYTVSQLCEAITGCSQSPHNMGDNERGQRYDGIHVIFRDADQIERFIRISKTPVKPPNASDQLLIKNYHAGKNWLNRKLMEEAR